MYASGIAVGDLNNDGRSDLLITCVGGDRLFQNLGDGKFQNVTIESGLDNIQWAASAAFFDYDRDGWLDLFTSNYVDYKPGHPCIGGSGRPDFCNPKIFPGTVHKLYRNTGGTAANKPANDETNAAPSPAATIHFEDVTVSAGIATRRGAGLGVMAGDYNADHWPDIFVANDGHDNFLWINQRDGTFRDEGVLYGVAYDTAGRPQGSMGVALGDIDQNGAPDLFVTNLDGEPHVLYAFGPSGVTERSGATGIARISFPFTGFGTAMFDVENDGDLDLAVTNGRVRGQGRNVSHAKLNDVPDTVDPFWLNYREPNSLLLNDGNGLFETTPNERDSFASTFGVGRALAVGDLDNDGDLDILVVYLDQPSRLYRNDSKQQGHWLSVRAVEPKLGGRDAYGAEIRLTVGERRQLGFVQPGGSYLSSHDPRVHFGMGEASQFDSIEVTWNDGQKEMFTGGPADQFVILPRGGGKPSAN